MRRRRLSTVLLSTHVLHCVFYEWKRASSRT
jgi:hypothetical protein